MLKRLVLAVCVLALAGASGCRTRNRYSYVMPPASKPSPSADYSRPALMAPAPTLAVSTSNSASAARPAAKPSPVLQAPASAEKKDSAATSVTSLSTVYRLKAGDPIVVYLRGIPGVPGGEQQNEDIIDENGSINMPYVGAIQAGGKTSTELEQAVQKAYIDQQIYKYVTVNVVVPARSYYVRGEIRQPGRFQLLARVTVVQAIAAAGGFTEFANPSKVEILRGNQRIRVDVSELEKHPERDKELESGDVIIVQRSFF
jgi:protein involved in polysaccharide export with SLBB domain